MTDTTKLALYGYNFELPNKYAEGHPLTAIEARALNRLRSENISHVIRRGLTTEFGATKDTTITEGSEAEAYILEKAQELAETYEFSMASRGGGATSLDPVEKEALAIARKNVRAKIKAAADRFPNGIGKADGSQDEMEGFYPYAKYAEKVAEVAEHPEVVKLAKAEVKRKQGLEEKADQLEIAV
jgi:hypothetical protein